MQNKNSNIFIHCFYLSTYLSIIKSFIAKDSVESHSLPVTTIQLSSPLAGIQCPQRADRYKLLLDSQYWCIHIWEPTGELHSWVRPNFSSRAYLVKIIIIMSCRQHRYPWSPLAFSPYRSSLLAGLQGYTLYPHIAAVCMFELVVLLLPGH